MDERNLWSRLAISFALKSISIFGLRLSLLLVVYKSAKSLLFAIFFQGGVTKQTSPLTKEKMADGISICFKDGGRIATL